MRSGKTEMIDFVENLFFILIETICCCLYFQTFSKFRFTKKIQILQFIGLTGCMTAVIYLFATIPFWKMPTVWFLFAVSMYGMFQMKFFEALGMGALYYALLLVVDVLAYACNDILQFRMGGETKVYGWKAWLIALLGKMFLFIIILFVRRIFGKSAVETLSKREWIKFLVFPIFTIFMITWMLVVVQSSQAGPGKIPIVLAFSLVGLNVFIYGLLYDILQKEVRTREYMVSMAKAEGKIQLYQKQTAFIHDYQNQMQCVRTLLMKKNYKEAEQYLEQMCNVGADVWNVIDTNHMIVNAVLNAKYQEAQESGIGVTIKINDLSGWRMAYNDVTILLANLLDNAIEACKLCKDKKHIWFKCVQEPGKIILSVKNTYCEMNRKKKEGLHGIGLKNVEHVITSYGGTYSIKKIQGKFIVTILFWMEE